MSNNYVQFEDVDEKMESGNDTTISSSPNVSFGDDNTTTISSSPNVSLLGYDSKFHETVNIQNVYTFFDIAFTTVNKNNEYECCNKFINNLSIEDIVTVLNQGKDVNHQVSKALYNKLIKNLNIIPTSVINKMNFDILFQFISRKDYPYVPFKLELTLAHIVSVWLEKNDNTCTETQYKSLWNNIIHELINPKTIAMFVKSKHYHTLKSEIGPDAAFYLANTLLQFHKTTKKERWETYDNKNDQDPLVIIPELVLSMNINELKQGDLIDCQDLHNRWYVSTVREITSTDILVNYSGWSENFDEWIPINSNRIMPFGKITTGKQHNANHADGEKCDCAKCIEAGGCTCENPKCENSLAISLLHPLFFQSIANESEKQETSFTLLNFVKMLSGIDVDQYDNDDDSTNKIIDGPYQMGSLYDEDDEESE